MGWTPRPTITVREVLEMFPRLGIPHFQRGRVWGTDAIASLLESLFYETPCGSFVFWASGDNAAFGVPLGETARAADVEFLIVDGQQRIRSLHDAFADTILDLDGDPSENSPPDDRKGPKRWCVNLARAPEFDKLLKPRARNFPLFVYAVDPKAASSRSPLRENILPLKVVRDKPDWGGLMDYHPHLAFRAGVSEKDGLRLAEQAYRDLQATIHEVNDREFFVATRDRASSLAEMAALYNRINAGGKQVETEERAFAALVGLQPENSSVSDGLRAIFDRVHPQDNRRTHDDLLKRQEERAFGFKLFIRVFLQVCQHHLGFRQGKSSFSFDLVGHEQFRRGFNSLSAQDVHWLWEETGRVLGHLRGPLLAVDLKCDDLRMLPDATSLMPVIQLLIQYPDLEGDTYRALLAGLCLMLALGDIESRELLRLVAAAGDPTRLGLDVASGLWDKTASRVRSALSSRLEDANSIQDRYVLLLYWLERHLGAQDFRYEAVRNKRNKLRPPELKLDREAKPEKQHLIPFARAASVFSGEVRRTESHPLNNVGNLTYISRQLNGLDALADDFADLDAERRLADDNLHAHLLLGDTGDSVLAHYLQLERFLQPDTDNPGASNTPLPEAKRLEARFSEFTKGRRRLIRAAFERWLVEVQSQAAAALKVQNLQQLREDVKGLPRVEPVAPRFPIDTHPAHLLRQLDLSHEAEDRLLAAVRECGAKEVPLGLVLRITKRKHVWLEVTRGGVTLLLSGSLVGPLRNGVLDAIGVSDTGHSAIRLSAVPDLGRLLEYCKAREEDIAKVVRESRKQVKAARRAPRRELNELGYAPQVRDRLSALGGDPRGNPRKGAALSLRFRRSKAGRGVEQVLRIDLYEGGGMLGFRCLPDLGKRLSEEFPQLVVRTSKHKPGCDVSGEGTMVAVLDWVADELARSAS